MTNPDLELITSDDLLAELARRFDHAIFAGMAVTVDNQDGTCDNYAMHTWKGCSLTCTGLAAEIQHRILRDRVTAEKDSDQ